jgi:hypothetical protein
VAPLGTLATTVPNGDRRGVSDAGAQRSRPAKPPRATSTTERAERRTTRWNGRRTSQWIAYHRAKRAAGTAGLDAGKWAAGGEDIGRLERLFRCGRHAVRLPEGQGGCVRLTAGPSTASYTGLASCASVWACPVCAERINAERATVNERAIDAAAAQGLQMAFVTLTMRHHAGQALGELWDALADALHAATVSDRAVQRGRELLGVRGLRRVVEPTHGPNGWHIHAHLIVFYDGLPEDPGERRDRLLDLAELRATDRKRVTRETERERMADEFDAGGDPDRLALDALAEPIWRGWRRRLVARGLEPPMREPGLVVSPVRVTGARHELARYVSKVSYDAAARGSARRTGIGVELSDPGAKRGRGMHRTPFEILADIDHRKRAGVLSRRSTAAQARDRAIWNEFVDASYHRRQMAWSPGLRQLLLGDDAELTDEQTALSALVRPGGCLPRTVCLASKAFRQPPTSYLTFEGLPASMSVSCGREPWRERDLVGLRPSAGVGDAPAVFARQAAGCSRSSSSTGGRRCASPRDSRACSVSMGYGSAMFSSLRTGSWCGSRCVAGG